MDFKDILPFIIFIAVSVIGAASRKKQKPQAERKKKNVFESLMEEIEEEINPKPIDPIMEMPTSSYEEPDYFKLKHEVPEEKVVEEKKPEHFKTKRFEKHNSFFESRKKKKKKHPYAINNLCAAKKAVVYSEIIKPKHF